MTKKVPKNAKFQDGVADLSTRNTTPPTQKQLKDAYEMMQRIASGKTKGIFFVTEEEDLGDTVKYEGLAYCHDVSPQVRLRVGIPALNVTDDVLLAYAMTQMLSGGNKN